MKKDTVTITDNRTGKQIECPVQVGTYGPPVIDIQSLYGELGMFTLDPGFLATGSCRSKITFIDGEEGILLHRGYPIEQLATQSNYLEVCYLLMHGELPTPGQMDDFTACIRKHTLVHEQVYSFYRGFRRDVHPMAMLVGTVGALSGFYHDSLDVNDPESRLISAHRMIAKMPTIAADTYKYTIGQPFVYPDNSLSYAENFLRMMFSIPSQEFEVNPVAVKALDLLLILHADHEQNASTSTVRLAGSSQANPYACISAGVATLWGPAHGGANEAVIQMLQDIGDVKNIGKFVARAKDKDDPFRLMGFGHRVYKNFDPRAVVIRQACHDLLGEFGTGEDPLFEIALELEKIALEEDYFIERKLYPNVDFYSGIILKAMGIPLSMYTVIFSMARTVGWVTQWMEMMAEEDQRIGRPRQLYIGSERRDYLPMGKRGG